jgi:putative membrane protein
MWWYGFPGWWGIGMMIIMVVFWGGIIALIVWAIMRFARGSGSNISARRDPLEIAKERYARGEITKEQFEQIKRDLS